MKIQGRAVYKLAVTHLVDVVRDLLERNSIDPKAIDVYIPHQMNQRIMEAAAQRLGISMDQVYLNIAKYGNTSAASIPIALDEAVRIQEYIASQTYETRKKDYDNPFRQITFDAAEEMQAVLGPLEENSFIKHVRRQTQEFASAVESARQRD